MTFDQLWTGLVAHLKSEAAYLGVHADNISRQTRTEIEPQITPAITVGVQPVDSSIVSEAGIRPARHAEIIIWAWSEAMVTASESLTSAMQLCERAEKLAQAWLMSQNAFPTNKGITLEFEESNRAAVSVAFTCKYSSSAP